MISKFAITALLALAICGPVQEAAAQDAVGGAIVGGVLGGVVGGALGGGRRCCGRRDRGRRDWRCDCGAGRAAAGRLPLLPERLLRASSPDGSWTAVSPRYCGAQVQYAPPPPQPRYYDDTPALHAFTHL